jgi:hypothetical protein
MSHLGQVCSIAVRVCPQSQQVVLDRIVSPFQGSISRGQVTVKAMACNHIDKVRNPML